MSDSISFDVILNSPFDDAIETVTGALKQEGFGVLTRIDMHKAFKEKLGKEFRPYAILGACNPALAHAAVTHHGKIGLLLPCNVTVQATPEGASQVSIGNPYELMKAGGFDEDETIQGVASDAHERLKRVADALHTAP